MNLATIGVLLILLVVVGFAIRSVVGNIKRGDLCGTCGNSCGGSCGHCATGLPEEDIEAAVAAIQSGRQ